MYVDRELLPLQAKPYRHPLDASSVGLVQKQRSAPLGYSSPAYVETVLANRDMRRSKSIVSGARDGNSDDRMVVTVLRPFIL